jgi:curved DNA-binding protein
MNKSLYDVLEVSQNASSIDIKKSYKRLARKYHPDINKSKDAEEKFKEINGAYEVLGDAKKKSQYDQMGDAMFGNQNFHDFSRSQGSGVDLNDIINEMFGGGFGNSGFGGSGFGGGFGNSGGFNAEDLDVNVKINIPFDIAVLGGKQHIVTSDHDFDVSIPAGVKEGDKLRVKGKGKSSYGQTGNMIIKIDIYDSPDYQRYNDDLESIVDVSLKTAMFGGKVDVKTPHKTISIKVPKSVRQYQKLRIKELGVKNRKSAKMGDFYVKLNIVIPKLDDLDSDLSSMLEDKLPD